MAMQKFAVLVEPWGVYVKEWSFFLEQGGRRQKWGRRWKPIMARDLESARRKGQKMEPYLSESKVPYWAKGGRS